MATNTITALGAGSGIDIKALAQSLTDAEGTPAKAVINKKIAQSTANISGYAALKFVVGNLKTAFADLKNQSSFNSIAPTNSQPRIVLVGHSNPACTDSPKLMGVSNTNNHSVTVGADSVRVSTLVISEDAAHSTAAATG